MLIRGKAADNDELVVRYSHPIPNHWGCQSQMKKEQTDSRLLLLSRLIVIAMSIFSLLLALAIPRLVELWMTGSAILVAGLLAPILIGLFWDKPDN
ncbi:hypothetical protein MUO14_17655 [Halobacillus shinanisalinarum]|uniref:Uncharacterized protein n=1 Tax=Halobacillus shinanisalinarum TaxID=2932258 RepID=A0ABY4GWF1_9BACI|nr:hypothetical protein [Halobacillus shinanisalinarum]UOQ92286.1 hypothetical protein MUO14_17655 [Halobacillus shinanisalinarum]